MSPDGTRFLLASDRDAELWSEGGERLNSLIGTDVPGVEAQLSKVFVGGFRPSGSGVATADRNGSVWLWDADGRLQASFLADYASPDRIFSVNLDPLDEYVLVTVRDRASLWGWDGKLRNELHTKGYKVWQGIFAPDGSRIVTVSDNPGSGPSAHIEVWDRSGLRIGLLNLPDAGVMDALSFDPKSRYFCVNGGDAVRIFDRDGTLLGTIAAARGTRVTAVALSPEGDKVAAALSDGKARLWEYASRKRGLSLDIGTSDQVIFSPDARHLLAATGSGQIDQHPLDVADLFPAARRRVGRPLTPEQIDRFGIQQPLRVRLDA